MDRHDAVAIFNRGLKACIKRIHSDLSQIKKVKRNSIITHILILEQEINIVVFFKIDRFTKQNGF